MHALPKDELPCPGCGTDRIEIGVDEKKRLELVPPRFFLDVHLLKKYACRPCRRHVTAAPGPELIGPLERGLPGPGLLAYIMVSKFADHLPLYRQSRMYERSDVYIPRSTLGDWIREGVSLTQPIVEAIKADVLSDGLIQTDDTVVRLIEPGLGRCRQARMWGYLGNGQVVYEFTRTRQQKWPLEFLKDYRGIVQCDAYKGYDKLFAPDSGRTELACWAHARRYFFNAQESDKKRAVTMLLLIRRLYDVEAKGRQMDPPQRVKLRCRKSISILDEIHQWMEVESLQVLPKSPIGEAIRYTSHLWTALTRFVEIGEAEIDNNRLERSLRGVAVGRKKYLHVGAESGGHWAAAVYSLVESCRMTGVEPWAYLKDVLMRVWTHPAGRIAELMPKRWKPPPDTT